MQEIAGFSFSTIGLSVFSGLGAYLSAVREERLKKSFLNFACEIILALIAGLAVAGLCKAQGVDENVVNAVVLIAANNGSESIFAIRKIINKFVK